MRVQQPLDTTNNDHMSGTILVTDLSEQEQTSSRGISDSVATSTREALRDFIVVSLACLLFLGISLFQLDLPGLYTDEAYDVIPAMQMVLGHPVELQGGVLDLGGLRLPLMSSSAYQGVTYTYLALPFFALGGVTVTSLRLMTVLVGVLGVILAYFLGRAWFGREVGCITAVMLALFRRGYSGADWAYTWCQSWRLLQWERCWRSPTGCETTRKEAMAHSTLACSCSAWG